MLVRVFVEGLYGWWLVWALPIGWPAVLFLAACTYDLFAEAWRWCGGNPGARQSSKPSTRPESKPAEFSDGLPSLFCTYSLVFERFWRIERFDLLNKFDTSC